MNKVINQYRQGDVLVTPVPSIPKTAIPIKTKNRIILAEGEATGHHHAIDYAPANMEVFTDRDQIYLKVNAPVVLTHQEHASATIDPGNYLVVRQVEAWMDEVRQVRD